MGARRELLQYHTDTNVTSAVKLRTRLWNINWCRKKIPSSWSQFQCFCASLEAGTRDHSCTSSWAVTLSSSLLCWISTGALLGGKQRQHHLPDNSSSWATVEPELHVASHHVNGEEVLAVCVIAVQKDTSLWIWTECQLKLHEGKVILWFQGPGCASKWS